MIEKNKGLNLRSKYLGSHLKNFFSRKRLLEDQSNTGEYLRQGQR